MAGGIDQGRVTTPAHAAGNLFREADLDDDVRLRRMLREQPVGGWVRMSYEREPDFFAAARLEGDAHRTLIAGSGDQVNAVFSHAIRTRYLNGMPRSVAYLGQLRVRAAHVGKRRLIRDGFSLCRDLLETADCEPFFLTTIISDNERARRILTAGLPGMPRYRPLGRLVVLAMRCGGADWRGDGSIRQAGETDVAELADFIDSQARHRDFAPVWTAQTLFGSDAGLGLSPSDFLLLRRDGRLQACAAIWDQRPIKQNVVRGYAGIGGHLRPLLNLVSPLTGLPRLPAVGQAVNTAFLSHFHVRPGQEASAQARVLVRAALALAGERGLDGLLAGGDVRDPVVAALRRYFRPYSYHSDVYAAHWPEGAAAVDGLGERILAPEVAIL